MEQLTGARLGKEYNKAVFCLPVYLTYMPRTSCEMLGWMKHKLESRLPGEITIKITIYSDFGAQENKVPLFPLFPYLFAMK